MDIELTIVLSIISVGTAVIFGISNFNNNMRKNAKEEGRIMQSLDDIKNVVNKTNIKVEKLSDGAMKLGERMAVIEEEQKATRQYFNRVNERIDRINEKVNGGNQ